MLLVENQTDNVQPLYEDTGDGSKKTFLSGVFMEAGSKNRNGRSYKLEEMKREVEKIQAAADQGRHILGEADHPSSLEISLKNVSHKITEMKMNGNQAVGKAEVLEKTQSGGILKGLMDSGVQVGVSSRGKGSVGANGIVENFELVTVDAVAVPSAHNAYPTSITESLEMYKRQGIITDLAEAVIHDDQAQKYFQKEIQQFIESLNLKTK